MTDQGRWHFFLLFHIKFHSSFFFSFFFLYVWGKKLKQYNSWDFQVCRNFKFAEWRIRASWKHLAETFIQQWIYNGFRIYALHWYVAIVLLFILCGADLFSFSVCNKKNTICHRFMFYFIFFPLGEIHIKNLFFYSNYMRYVCW